LSSGWSGVETWFNNLREADGNLVGVDAQAMAKFRRCGIHGDDGADLAFEDLSAAI
jgi:hypothetical protein